MPLCYGGGIKTVEQAKSIIGLGVEKIAISSAAVENPRLISAIAREVGSQSVVVVLDVRKRPHGSDYEVWTSQRTQNTGKLAELAVEEAERSVRVRSSSTPSTTTA